MTIFGKTLPNCEISYQSRPTCLTMGWLVK